MSFLETQLFSSETLFPVLNIAGSAVQSVSRRFRRRNRNRRAIDSIANRRWPSNNLADHLGRKVLKRFSKRVEKELVSRGLSPALLHGVRRVPMQLPVQRLVDHDT